MKNILSYPLGTLFHGSEIKEWITYHLQHETSKTKICKRMEEYLNIDDEDLYYLIHGDKCSSRENDFLVKRHIPLNTN